MDFDGKTYDPERDRQRLTSQYLRVWNLMIDGRWRTLSQIAHGVGSPEASVSARLRDMRKDRFGSHIVEREFVSRGLFRYRLVKNEDPPLVVKQAELAL